MNWVKYLLWVARLTIFPILPVSLFFTEIKKHFCQNRALWHSKDKANERNSYFQTDDVGVKYGLPLIHLKIIIKLYERRQKVIFWLLDCLNVYWVRLSGKVQLYEKNKILVMNKMFHLKKKKINKLCLNCTTGAGILTTNAVAGLKCEDTTASYPTSTHMLQDIDF